MFLIVTSCIKVGKNEEYSHPTSSLRRKICRKECKSALIIEKCFALLEEKKRQERGRRQKKPKKRKLHFRKKVGPFLFLNRLLIFFCCIVRAILESENEILKYYFMKTNNILNNILNIKFNAGFVSCEYFCNKLTRIEVLNALNAIYPSVQIVL